MPAIRRFLFLILKETEKQESLGALKWTRCGEGLFGIRYQALPSNNLEWLHEEPLEISCKDWHQRPRYLVQQC